MRGDGGDGLGQVDHLDEQKRNSLAQFAGEYTSKATQMPHAHKSV